MQAFGYERTLCLQNIAISLECTTSASAVLTIGAATLADIYEPHERGTMMGIYYAAPLLGPSMGPLLGGILTQLFNWRATFWFLAIFGGLSLSSFILFKDTFRRERSLAYQAALRRMQIVKQRKSSGENTPAVSQTTTLNSPDCQDKKIDKSGQEVVTSEKDAEAQIANSSTVVERSEPQNIQDIKLSLKGVNPVTPLFAILRRRNNLAILAASGTRQTFSSSSYFLRLAML